MVSRNNHPLPEETMGEQKERKAGYDFPEYLAPWQRFAYQLAHYSDNSEYTDELEFGYDLIPSDAIIPVYSISLISSEERRDMAKVRGSVEFIDLSETSKHEAMDLTEEVASNFTSPLDTIDSTTGSPNGYRGRGSQIREEGILESTSQKLSDAKDPLLEAQSDSEERFSPNSRQNSESLSSQCPNTTEKREPNSPRGKKRSASRCSTTRGTNKRKREKIVFQSWASSSF